MIGKSVDNANYNLLKIQEEEGRQGRKDLGNTKAGYIEGSKIWKLAWECQIQGAYKRMLGTRELQKMYIMALISL